MSNKGLREIEGLLLLPSMQGLAMQHGRKISPCDRSKGDEENNSYMASESSREGR